MRLKVSASLLLKTCPCFIFWESRNIVICASRSSISEVLLENEEMEESNHGDLAFSQKLCVECSFVVGFYIGEKHPSSSSTVQVTVCTKQNCYNEFLLKVSLFKRIKVGQKWQIFCLHLSFVDSQLPPFGMEWHKTKRAPSNFDWWNTWRGMCHECESMCWFYSDSNFLENWRPRFQLTLISCCVKMVVPSVPHLQHAHSCLQPWLSDGLCHGVAPPRSGQLHFEWSFLPDDWLPLYQLVSHLTWIWKASKQAYTIACRKVFTTGRKTQ